MKKILLFLMVVMALPKTAQNTPFPKKGYDIKWIKRTSYGFDNYSCSIKKFEDSDTLYYISYVTPGMPPYSICFGFIGQSSANKIAEVLEGMKKKERIKWIKEYLAYTNVYDVGQTGTYNDYWTFFKPKATERGITTHFNLASALYAFHRDRDRDKRWANTTPEQWLQLYEGAKIILPIMGEGATYRTQYDKILNGGR